MTAGLLEKESTGGATARVGFEYQDAYVLQNLPRWLAQCAFSHVVSEAVGDVQVCYYAPARAVRHLMVEAKSHALSSTEFWDEVARFKQAHEASALEHVQFALVCPAYNGKTSPFVAMLERLRGVGLSYQAHSTILQRDREEVLAWAKKQEVSEDLAAFALHHVEFAAYSAESADAAFAGEVERHLPSIDLTGKQAARLRDRFKEYIASSSSGPVYRNQLESALTEVLAGNSTRWAGTPTRVSLSGEGAVLEQLALPADEFVGLKRSAKVASDWQELSESAQDIAAFLARNTERRRVALDGRQGMSAACLLGHAFRATNNFVLHVEHNGVVYRTDVYEQAAGPFFHTSVQSGTPDAAQGAMSIAFTTEVGADLDLALVGVPEGTSVLSLSGKPVASHAEMNLAVAEAKAALVKFRSEHRLEVLHLFIKGPAAFAMLLGHRLNGVCRVQLYDWVEGAYRATALLDA
ncbi:dsDNA nuclease domain-containing protein [Variovorax sp. OV084]|uniref:CD-NTase-associated endodeoxyribonuclease Cap4 n=1 Tax=Variovorax sp. OV084 TaxID=1882777 RepID=UPI0008C13590|nr:dsDNA nuclease domain-containing protein [Variovorax sp. OV084]SEU21032.1 hypothetical protein SAMN05443580_1291 [Variovorax sp. OV084]